MRVLVSDDMPDVREALRLLLKGAGHEADTVDSPAAVLQAASLHAFDLILLDLNYTRDTTSGREGLDLLAELEARRTPAPVVVMTAWGDIALAVEAMRRGAADFVQKPWDNARLVETLERQAREHAGRAAATRRERWDMQVARDVQQRLFPASLGELPGLECAARCDPAGEVGGDYYDFLAVAGGRTGMVLADVSGKGISAAILMAHLRASFHSLPPAAFSDPVEALGAVHRLFWESTPGEQYATLVWADYDPSTRILRYVNCGHPAPVLVRAGGNNERLAPTATVFGLLPRWTAAASSVKVEPGDTLWLFSDGITEATAPDGEEYGAERLVRLLDSLRGRALDESIGAVLATAVPFDDRTLVGVRVR